MKKEVSEQNIKRFNEYGRYYDQDGFEYRVEEMLNNLAEHIERIEKWVTDDKPFLPPTQPN